MPKTKTTSNAIIFQMEDSMPRIILEFSLPEEQYEYNAAVNGIAWKSVVSGIALELRNALKYGHSYKTPEEALDAIQNALCNSLTDEGLDLYD